MVFLGNAASAAPGEAALPDFKGAPYGAATNVLTAGSTHSYQYWYRDPGSAAMYGCANDTSSGDFNWSNAVNVAWAP